VGILPEALAKAPLRQIERAIRRAGLYKGKAKAIRKAAATISGRYGGSMAPIFSLPLDQARECLMKFPGVGPKTADVVLLLSAKQPTIPVDTHVNRVAKRLGLAAENGDYESVRGSLQKLFEPIDYLCVHLLFIAHGRKTCRALRPLCRLCSVKAYCPSNGKWEKQ